jgi:hypothetical protein
MASSASKHQRRTTPLDEITHQAEVLAIKFALASVIEVLSSEQRTAIRETIAQAAKRADRYNALLPAGVSIGEEQSHRLRMALQQIVDMIDGVHHGTRAV